MEDQLPLKTKTNVGPILIFMEFQKYLMLGPMSTNFFYADPNFIAFWHFHVFDFINYCDYVLNFDTIC